MENTLKIGEWKHPEITDLRSPCPVINALANHGYLPRDGRNITGDHLNKTLQEVLGLAPDMSLMLSKPIFMLHTGQDGGQGTSATEEEKVEKKGQSFLHGFFTLPSLPTVNSESNLGLRNEGQVNDKGEPVLNLDQLSRHGAIEHDVSLSRKDAAQGDNTSLQPDLLSKLLNAASDGKTFTVADMAHLRNERLKEQQRDNPNLKFGLHERFLGFGEVALIMCVYGTSIKGGYDKIPKEYMKALFADERLPFQEGWQRRSIPVTFAEVTANSAYVQGTAFFDSRSD